MSKEVFVMLRGNENEPVISSVKGYLCMSIKFMFLISVYTLLTHNTGGVGSRGV
jgi:hypothetical protein